MTKPDILVIGAMKCATSTICAYLEDHPEVFMVPRAEPNFFNRDENWARGPEWYDGFFAGRTTERLCGEGSNDYTSGTTWPETAARIRAFAPEVRLVYMVRHPIERIVSAWVQYRKNKGDFVDPDIDRAVRARRALFVEQSAYFSQLQRYRAHFPDSQIFLGFMDDLMADEAGELRRLCAFLGIDPEVPATRPQVNPSLGKELPSARLTALRRVPGLAATARLAPAGLRQALRRRFFTTRLDSRPALSPALHAELADELREDSAALLRHAGKPADFWTLD